MNLKQSIGLGIIIGTPLGLFGVIGHFVGYKIVFSAVGIALLLAALISFGAWLMEDK